MRILVTGATGFIGRHLVARLRQDGYVVRALAHDPGWPTTCLEGIESVVGDVCDAQAMKTVAAGCDVVFHLAGKAHVLTEVRGDEEQYRAVNVEGTRHVLEGAVAGGARRFVLFSSVKAMGEGGDRCLNETFEGPPETPYGRSKLEAERLVLDGGQRAGLHVSCLRLPLVYGPGIKGYLYQMIAAIDRGFFPPLPEAGNRRSLVSVSNVAEASLLAAGAPVANGSCYIVTDSRAYSTRELYDVICRGLGKSAHGWHVPLGALKAMGKAGDVIGLVRGKRFLFDSDALEKLVGSAWYSSEKMSRELGYQPAITLEDAMPEMIVWYRQVKA